MPPPATPFLAHPYKCPGGMGVNTSILKVLLELFCSQRTFPCKKPFCKSFVFFSLRTLPSSVSCKSFAWHSYENCRVCTNSSHFGTLSPEPVQGATPLRAASARSASLRHPFPLFASQLSTLNCQSKIPSGSGLLTLLSCATLECCFTAQFHDHATPISGDPRPPQRGQVHPLQSLDRHAPLHRHQRARHHPRPHLWQG